MAVALSMSTWRQGNVAPATTDLPIAGSAAESEQLQRTLRGHKEFVSSVVFSPNGKFLASSAAHGAVILWDPSAGKIIRTLTNHRGLVHSIAFSPDSRSLAVAVFDEERGKGPGEIQLWDAITGKPGRSLTRGEPGAIRRVVFSPDGRTVAAVVTTYQVNPRRQRKTEVVLWEVEGGRVRSAFETLAAGLLFSPDGKSILTLGRQIQVWDVESGQQLARLPGTCSMLSYSPDGTLLAGADPMGNITFWDMSSFAVARKARFEEGLRVFSLAYSPDGKLLALATGDQKQGEVILLDPTTFERRQTLRGHRGPVQALAFSPDGHTLASGSQDWSIRIWHLEKPARDQ